MPGIKFCALLTSILGPGSFALMKEKLMLHVFLNVESHQEIPKEAAVLVDMVVVDMVGEGR